MFFSFKANSRAIKVRNRSENVKIKKRGTISYNE